MIVTTLIITSQCGVEGGFLESVPLQNAATIRVFFIFFIGRHFFFTQNLDRDLILTTLFVFFNVESRGSQRFQVSDSLEQAKEFIR